MAMRKIGSRALVVDGQRYRWRVRRSPTYVQGAYAAALTFSVQREDGGSVLRVVADGPRPDNWLERPGAIITPAVVAGAIRRARACGWRAGEVGPVFELALAPDV
jgi:hypothetical protein